MIKKLPLVIFLLFSFNAFANEGIKFEDYLLKENFKKEIFRDDYFWSWDFRIFNNKKNNRLLKPIIQIN